MMFLVRCVGAVACLWVTTQQVKLLAPSRPAAADGNSTLLAGTHALCRHTLSDSASRVHDVVVWSYGVALSGPLSMLEAC